MRGVFLDIEAFRIQIDQRMDTANDMDEGSGATKR